PTLRHYGLKAEMRKRGEGGYYWIIAGGDVVLFASSQVPAGERDVWNPPLDQLMASLQITRDEELFRRRVANDLLAELRKRHPDEEFTFDDKGIRGKRQTVFLSNLFREVRTHPERQAEIIKAFVSRLGQAADAPLGYEAWEEAKNHIVPVLKPKGYIRESGPTRHLHITEWLSGVVICYAIQSKKFFRFVTGWDVN